MAVAVAGRARVLRCTACGVPGHYRSTCPTSPTPDARVLRRLGSGRAAPPGSPRRKPAILVAREMLLKAADLLQTNDRPKTAEQLRKFADLTLPAGSIW